MSWAFLPAIEPEETLYGWSSFVHLCGAKVSSEETARMLFGFKHMMRQHEVPARVDALAGLFASASSLPFLIRDHTLLGTYWPFASIEVRMRSLAEASAGSKYWARPLLSVSRSHSIFHPLRLCCSCINEDQDRLGRPLWHTAHQFPGAWGCFLHGAPLRWASISGKRWVTPAEALPKSCPLDESHLSCGMIGAAVATAASALESIDAAVLRDAVLTRLCDIGVLRSRYRTPHRRIVSWFKSTSIARLCAHPDSGLQSLADGDWIAPQLWRQRRSNPARWLVLWSSLEWANALEAGTRFTDACLGRTLEPSGQASFRCADALGPTPAKVWSAIRQSSSYLDAMLILGCTRGDLVHWLERDPRLRAEWRSCKAARRLERIENELRHSAALAPAGAKHGKLSPLSDADRRWLRRHRPELQAAYGLARCRQKPLL